MASVTARSVALSQTATLGSKKAEVVAVATATRFARDKETRQVTETIDGFAVNVLSAKGETQTVKLPKDSEAVVKEIQVALQQDKVVRVTFDKWLGRFWAMIDPNTGRVNQGISVNASAVKIVSIEEVEDLDELMDEVVL